MMSKQFTAAKRALRTMRASTGMIKGQASLEPGDGLVPAYSASGQDVWVNGADAPAHGVGLVLSAVGARSGKCFLANHARWGTVANTQAWAIDSGWNPRFVHYFFDREEFWEKGGAAQPYVKVEESLRKPMPILALSEQRALADFLDRETAKIDALIEKQNELVSLLRERRSQLIWSVVTGLGHAGQADRGREPWLPRLPTGWGSARIGYDFLVTLGKMLDAGRDAFEDDVVTPYIRAANIQDSGLALGDVNEMPFRPSELIRLDIRRGDLLVVEGGSIGTSFWVPEDIPGWSFQKTVNRVRSRGRASTQFLGYVLRAYRDRGILGLLGDGSTIAHLTAEKLRSLRVPKPPYDMQVELVDHLDHETAKIDSLIEKAEDFVALVKERRAALITAAVTGQIDVLGKAS